MRWQRHAVVVGILSLLAVTSGLAERRVTVVGADGRWSHDPGANRALADRVRDQALPKLARTSSGDWYVAWYDDAEGGYDPTIQLLDRLGSERFAHDGIRLADTQFQYRMDYGLAVTSDGSALMAYRDDPGGVVRVAAHRVAPDGTLAWGSDGIEIDARQDFLGPPKIAATADDGVAVAWTRDDQIRVRKLDGGGQQMWTDDVVFRDPAGADQYVADLKPTPDGGVVVSWVHTRSYAYPRHLWAQRLAADGTALWGAVDGDEARQPLVIFDGGTLQYGDFPSFLADGEGGAVFGWYETFPVLQVRVQHVHADGSTRFAANGLLVAEPDPSIERVEPAIAYDERSRDIFAFWREMPPSGPLAQAVKGQRVSASGTLSWGPGGMAIEAAGEHEVTQLQAASLDSDVLVAYVEKTADGRQLVWLGRLGADGADRWAPPRIAVSTFASVKSRLALAAGAAGDALLVWEDDRSGDRDIYDQNANADGSLGPPGIPSPTASATPVPGTTTPATATASPSPSPWTRTPSPTATGATSVPSEWWAYLPSCRKPR